MYRFAGKLIAVVALLIVFAPHKMAASSGDDLVRQLRLKQGVGNVQQELPVEVTCRASGEIYFRIGPFDITEPVVYEFERFPEAGCNSCNSTLCDQSRR
jgi:hypothetical protein